MTEDNPGFRSLRELAALLDDIGMRLHSMNRVSGGESGATWHLAEMIRAVGQLAARIEAEPELRGLYGDASGAGSLPSGEQQAHFLRMLNAAVREDK